MKCAHGTNQCGTWPEPDQLGRYRCHGCGCFGPRGGHSWCKTGQTAARYLNTRYPTRKTQTR